MLDPDVVTQQVTGQQVLHERVVTEQTLRDPASTEPALAEQALVEQVFTEQYCETCRAETDQEVGPADGLATCLRCGGRNHVRGEDDRVRALVERVREEDLAALGRLRAGPVGIL